MTNDDLANRPLSDLERRIAASAPACDATARDAVLFQAGLAQGLRAARRQAWRAGALASAASIALSLTVVFWNSPNVFEPGARPATIPAPVATDAPGHRASERVGESVASKGATSDQGVLTPVGVLPRVGEPTSFDRFAPRGTDENSPAADAGVWRAGMSLTNWDL